MNQKLIDYDRTKAVIQSCITNPQNQVAYRMVWNFSDKHKDDTLSLSLFDECDRNLIQVCR